MRARLIRSLATVILTVLLGGLLATLLVRHSPGFGVDERELDARFSHESVRRIREEARQPSRGLLSDYVHTLGRAAAGDLGMSATFRRPVAELIAERLPETAQSAGMGLVCGWTLGMLVALAGAALARPVFDLLAGSAAAFFLCLPSSVLALGLALAGRLEPRPAVALVVTLVVFPRVFGYARAILGSAARAPHVLLARAKGVPPARLLWAHLLRPAAPAVLALLGVSVSVALAAAIPVEVLCDSPGLGQLAWRAALGRDLPLLVPITLLVSLLAGVFGLAAEIARPSPAAGP
jgi:peptide/nickel transport system permease protein